MKTNLEVIGCIGEKIKKTLQFLGQLGKHPETESGFLLMLMRYLSDEEFDLLQAYGNGPGKHSYNKWLGQLFVASGFYEVHDGVVRAIVKN